MRISDWRSDVCSSDLIVRADDDLGGAVVHVEDGPAAIALHHQMIDGDDERLARAFYRHDRKMIGVADPPDLDRIEADEPRRADARPQAEVEIGRASCRERVCQYV